MNFTIVSPLCKRPFYNGNEKSSRTAPSIARAIISSTGSVDSACSTSPWRAFVAGCFGFSAAFTLSLIPTIFGVVGLVLAIIGGVVQHPVGVEDTHVLSAIVLSIAVLVGGLLEVAIWRGVPIFAGGGGM